MARAATAIIRPSWPPPRMPIVAGGRIGSTRSGRARPRHAACRRPARPGSCGRGPAVEGVAGGPSHGRSAVRAGRAGGWCRPPRRLGDAQPHERPRRSSDPSLARTPVQSRTPASTTQALLRRRSRAGGAGPRAGRRGRRASRRARGWTPGSRAGGRRRSVRATRHRRRPAGGSCGHGSGPPRRRKPRRSRRSVTAGTAVGGDDEQQVDDARARQARDGGAADVLDAGVRHGRADDVADGDRDLGRPRVRRVRPPRGGATYEPMTRSLTAAV